MNCTNFCCYIGTDRSFCVLLFTAACCLYDNKLAQFIVVLVRVLQNVPFNLMWAAITLLFYLHRPRCWISFTEFQIVIKKDTALCSTCHSHFNWIRQHTCKKYPATCILQFYISHILLTCHISVLIFILDIYIYTGIPQLTILHISYKLQWFYTFIMYV